MGYPQDAAELQKRPGAREQKAEHDICIVSAATDLLQYSNASEAAAKRRCCFLLTLSADNLVAPCLVYTGRTAYDSRCVSLQGSIQLSKSSYQLVPLLRR